MADQALTALAVERLKPREKRFEVPDSRARGLRITVLPSGVKSWSVRYRHGGRGRRLVLGQYPAIGLDDARKLAASAVREAIAGDDPQARKIEQRRRAATGADKEQTFGAAWARFLAEHVNKRRPATAREYARLGAKVILPKFGRRKLADIGPGDVKGLVRHEEARGATVQANRLLAVLRKFFNWCIDELLLSANPCTGLKRPHQEELRDRILTDSEIRWLWRAGDKIGFPFGPMVKLLLLTGARREEARGIRRSEIDLQNRLWKLPGDRTKNGRPHSIYLTDQALAVLRSIPHVASKEGFVFTTNGKTAASGLGKAKARLDSLVAEYAKAEGAGVSPFTLHDLRRTVASGMARLGIALPVIERCLNHVSGSFGGIVAVYQRHEFAAEMKSAFTSWADHVEHVVSPI